MEPLKNTASVMTDVRVEFKFHAARGGETLFKTYLHGTFRRLGGHILRLIMTDRVSLRMEGVVPDERVPLLCRSLQQSVRAGESLVISSCDPDGRNMEYKVTA